jgi:carboxyl-terminal processing protease
MQQDKHIPAILAVVIFSIFAFTGGYLLGQSPVAPVNLFGIVNGRTVQNPDDIKAFWEVWDLIHTRYLRQPVDDAALMDGAINGMLETLGDPHTRYLSPSDQEAATQSMSGEFQGIGAEVENVDGAITIVTPIDGSPAQAAGLQPGDILREADGVPLTDMDISEAAALVRGPAGTTVRLLIERDGETFEVEITRDVIKLPSARGEMLDEGIAYIRLSRFANNTDQELQDILTDLLAQNPTGIILDLRRNPGGALDTTVNIADQFLPEGVALVERFGDGRERQFQSSGKGLAEDIPLVVLIDEGSASASEVLSGAIQDRGRGVLIGNTSFGKGTVQTWQTLANDGGVRITIAEWLTPDKDSINETGLTPDYFIPLDPDNPDEDAQLQAAIDYLLGKTIISIPPAEEELENN